MQQQTNKRLETSDAENKLISQQYQTLITQISKREKEFLQKDEDIEIAEENNEKMLTEKQKQIQLMETQNKRLEEQVITLEKELEELYSKKIRSDNTGKDEKAAIQSKYTDRL